MTPTEKEPAREPEIATGTLAEIYAQQGLYDRALEIYRRMESRRPDDPEIARRIAAIERARDERDVEEEEEPEPGETLGSEAGEAPTEESAEPDTPPLDEDEAFREWLRSR